MALSLQVLTAMWDESTRSLNHFKVKLCVVTSDRRAIEKYIINCDLSGCKFVSLAIVIAFKLSSQSIFYNQSINRMRCDDLDELVKVAVDDSAKLQQEV